MRKILFLIVLAAAFLSTPANADDSKYTYKISGWMQIDYRDYLRRSSLMDTFDIRRARLDVKGTLEHDFAYRLYADFEHSSARLHEGWIEYRKFPCAKVKIGEFKIPFSTEEICSSRWIHFIERGLGPTNLSPKEDIGMMLFGDLFCDRVKYDLAIFNGSGKNVVDADNDKEGLFRLTYQPFRHCCDTLFERLYLGANVTGGRVDKVIDDIDYVTAGRTPFFSYATGTYQDGAFYRGGFDVEWYCGPWQVSGEYIVSDRHGIRTGAGKATVVSRTWYIEGSYLLTGETQPRHGPVDPCYPFDPCERNFGAWEIGVRYEDFRTSSEAFDFGIATGRGHITAYTAGLIWWPTIATKFMLNYVYTDFYGDLTLSDITVDQEQVLLFRMQYVF